MTNFKPLITAFFLTCGTALVYAGEPIYSGKGTAGGDVEWGGPIIGAGFMSNDEFSEAAFFSLIPVVNSVGEGEQMSGSVFFVEPYGTWAEEGELGPSLGVGFRRLFSNQSVDEAVSNTSAGFMTEGVFVGANAFVDYAETSYGNEFWQTGVGIEIGTRYLEFRSNYYYPHTDAQEAGSRTTEFTKRSSTTTNQTFVAPVPGGTQTTRVKNTTTRSTTTSTTFTQIEEAMEGADFEMSLLLPGVDQHFDVKLIGGYYAYSGDFVSDIDGWRAGIEARPIPAMVLHATWFENDGLYEDNWLAGVRFEIPLDKNAARKAFQPRRRHLAERLFEPVRRKNAAITTAGETKSTGSTTTSNTTTEVDRSVSFDPTPPPIDEVIPE